MLTSLLSNRFRCILAFGLSCIAAVGGAQASESFPTRPVTIVVPYPAGGGTDATARAMAQALSHRWKQTVVVENVGGGDGIIGTQRALRSPPDGHTIIFQLTSSMLLWKTANPDQKDLVSELKFLTIVQRAPIAFAVRGDFPSKNMKEFLDWCRSNACSAGTGTSHARLVMMSLLDAAGIKNAVTIPYKGGAPMLNDLVGGHVSIATPSVAAVQTQLASGTIKFMAVGSKERFPGSPETPTLSESGYPIVGESVYGVIVSALTPPHIARTITESVRAIADDPSLVSTIKKSVAQPVFSTTQEYEDYVRRESAYLDALLKKQ